MYVIWFDKFIPILSFLYLSQRKKTTKKNSVRVIWQDFQIVNLSRIQKPTVMLKTSMLCWMEFWEWFLCGSCLVGNIGHESLGFGNAIPDEEIRLLIRIPPPSQNACHCWLLFCPSFRVYFWSWGIFFANQTCAPPHKTLCFVGVNLYDGFELLETFKPLLLYMIILK